MLLPAIPVATISVCLYIGLAVFGHDANIWITSIAIGVLISFAILRNIFLPQILEIKQIINFKNLPLLFILALFLLAKAFVISPLVVTKSIDNFTHIQITGVGDYYKHTFVVSALSQDGIPPKNPYYPISQLSYYFGFYLIPAGASRILDIPPNISLYVWTILTDAISLFILFCLITALVKNYFLKFAALTLLVTGFGIDSISIIASKTAIFSEILPPEIFDRGKGLQLINNYTAFLYVPQHFLAASLSLGLIYNLLKKKINLAHVSILSSYIFLTSLFVVITLSFWLLLLFIVNKSKRVFLAKAGILALILTAPYLLQLSGRENLLYFYRFKPFSFIPEDAYLAFTINSLLSALVSYGPAALLAGILLKNTSRKNIPLAIGLTSPVIATWFIRSPVFNDFSMRTLMPIQLILPVLIMLRLERDFPRTQKLFISLLCLLAAIIGLSGIFLEYSSHWKSRQFLDPKDSELIFQIRKLPKSMTISSFENARWVELTPSLGFKKIFSPFLFDSYVYFVGDLGQAHGLYERQALDLFQEPFEGENISDLIDEGNIRLQTLKKFIENTKADQIVVSNKLWVKQDVSPWVYIFRSMNVKNTALTPHYTLFDRADILSKLTTFSIKIENKPEKINIQDHKFYLTQNLWFISYCNEAPEQTSSAQYVKLEFEDYYLLFDKTIDKKNCVGKIFYMPKNGEIETSSNSTVEWVYLSPIEIAGML